MHKDDAIRLRHMLDAAREALSFVAGKRRAELDVHRMLALSLVKSIEIIGEAANRVSLDCRARCNEIPRSDIIAMRNRLIHAYFDINLDIVWQTVTQELPSLVVELEKALASGGTK
jgi:uncharacterized protein with HEPN domain